MEDNSAISTSAEMDESMAQAIMQAKAEGIGCEPRHCERSEAIQEAARKLDCFVASAPRNDD
jgi:rRNA-processing protein FCF1